MSLLNLTNDVLERSANVRVGPSTCLDEAAVEVTGQLLAFFQGYLPLVGF